MPTHSWTISIESEERRISVKTSRWSGSGEIIVDGKIVDAWGSTIWLGERLFSVGGKDARLIWPGLISFRSELIVDGVRIKRG
jgi:hypothetical protein